MEWNGMVTDRQYWLASMLRIVRPSLLLAWLLFGAIMGLLDGILDKPIIPTRSFFYKAHFLGSTGM